MRIDPKALAHIMQVLTDLYSDPELAVIREYSTNAWDAHVEAGIFDPIEIDLPSTLRPLFVVRDHGVGMSEDTILNEFSMYGNSSKRDTNEQAGILGLGCKSGLTYTNQFTLVSRKDGREVTALVGRDDHGVGKIDILSNEDTTERNGVEIRIPVTNSGTFVKKADHFFRFWKKGTVLVNGKAPTSIFEDDDETLKLDDDIVLVKSPYSASRYNYGRQAGNISFTLDQDYIVMGNIPYPAEQRLSGDTVSSYHHVVARVDIGEIDFTPSREALHYTKHTQATCLAIQKFVSETLFRHAQDEVNKQPTRWEGARAALRWTETMGSRSKILDYRGEKIPLQIPIKGWSWGDSYSGKSSKCGRIDLQSVMNSKGTVLVRNHPIRSMDAPLKEALKDKYGADLGLVYAITELEKPEHEIWLEGVTQEEYADIRPKHVRQAKGSGPAIEIFKWMVYRDGKFVETDSDLATPHQICYILRTDPQEASGLPHTRERYRQLCAEFIERINKGSDLETVEFAVVRTPNLDNFLKLHPEAKTFAKFCNDLLATVERKLSDDALSWGVTPHDLASYDASTIDDPSVAALVRRIQACMQEPVTALHKQRKEVITAAHQLGRLTLSGRQFKSDIKDRLEEWQRTYPLAGRMLGRRAEHLEYLNAVYAYRQGKKVSQ